MTPTLWTVQDLAGFLLYSPATLRRMVSTAPERLPPRVPGLRRQRWHPETVHAWAVERGGRPVMKPSVGRPRAGR